LEFAQNSVRNGPLNTVVALFDEGHLDGPSNHPDTDQAASPN
jgi:hypothetical protein